VHIKLRLGDYKQEELVDQVKIRYRTNGGEDDSIRDHVRQIWVTSPKKDQTDPTLHLTVFVPDSRQAEIESRTKSKKVNLTNKIRLVMAGVLFFFLGRAIGKAALLGGLLYTFCVCVCLKQLKNDHSSDCGLAKTAIILCA